MKQDIVESFNSGEARHAKLRGSQLFHPINCGLEFTCDENRTLVITGKMKIENMFNAFNCLMVAQGQLKNQMPLHG